MQQQLFPYYFPDGLFKKVKTHSISGIEGMIIEQQKQIEFQAHRIAGLEGFINSKKQQQALSF